MEMLKGVAKMYLNCRKVVLNLEGGQEIKAAKTL